MLNILNRYDIYQKPEPRIKTPYTRIQGKDRKRKYTCNTVRHIIESYGNIKTFIKAVKDLKTVAPENSEDDLNLITFNKQDYMKELKADAFEFSPGLITLSKTTKRQWEFFKRSIPFLPCYRTSSDRLKDQKNISKETETEFFKYLEDGNRIFLSNDDSLNVPYYSLENKLRWILYLIVTRLDIKNLDINIDFAIWGDGAGSAGNFSGLFSAIKGINVQFRNDGTKVDFNYDDIKWIISTVFRLYMCKDGETTESVDRLEDHLLKQYNNLPDFIEYQGCKLRVKIYGWTADHGYRLKAVGNDSASSCGECSFFKKELLNVHSYHFLNWSYLINLVEITDANWNIYRNKDMPERLTNIKEKGISLLSYDNHHNIVGFIKRMYHCLVYKAGDKHNIINQRMKDITGIYDVDLQKKKNKTFRSSFPYPGWKWRVASLNFKYIFAGIFDEKISKELEILFDLFNEIHMINYTHFDRSKQDFDKIIHRYWMVLYCFSKQLKIIFNTEDEANMINNIYLHKILVHSPRIFMKFNLSAFSCEQGEGSISVSNRVIKTNGVTRDVNMSISKTLLYHVLSTEYSIFVQHYEPSGSRIFKDSHVNIQHIYIQVDTESKYLVDCLRKGEIAYFNGAKYKTSTKRRGGSSYYSVSNILGYGNQDPDLPYNSISVESKSIKIFPDTVLDFKKSAVKDKPKTDEEKLAHLKSIRSKNISWRDKGIANIKEANKNIQNKLLSRWNAILGIVQDFSGYNRTLTENAMQVFEPFDDLEDCYTKLIEHNNCTTPVETKEKREKDFALLLMNNESIKKFIDIERKAIILLKSTPRSDWIEVMGVVALLKSAQSFTMENITLLKDNFWKPDHYSKSIQEKDKKIGDLKLKIHQAAEQASIATPTPDDNSTPSPDDIVTPALNEQHNISNSNEKDSTKDSSLNDASNAKEQPKRKYCKKRKKPLNLSSQQYPRPKKRQRTTEKAKKKTKT